MVITVSMINQHIYLKKKCSYKTEIILWKLLLLHLFNSPLSRTTQVSRYQKGKTNLDFTEARDSEWQWHQLGMCKSAPHSRQITTPAPHHSVFIGRMPFLPPNQQRQSTEGNILWKYSIKYLLNFNICLQRQHLLNRRHDSFGIHFCIA